MGMKSFIGNVSTGMKGLFSVPGYASDQADIPADYSLMKAYVSNKYLYKPPFGYPRDVEIANLRLLSQQPYVFMVTQTIIDEVVSVDWDIVPKEIDEPKGSEEQEKDDVRNESNQAIGVQRDPAQLKRIHKVKDWFYNPNKNEESFEHLERAFLRDVLELDSGVWVKVFSRAGEFVEMFARDGGTFLKNPDPFGYLGHRAEYVEVPQRWAMYSNAEKTRVYENIFKTNAAYFQYGAIGMMPIPFGRREIIYAMRNPRSDSVYGRSPVQILEEIILTLFYGSKYNLEFYTNNNMPEGVIQVLGAQQDEITAFRKRFEAQFRTKDVWGNTRKQFHKFPMVNTEVKFTPLMLKPAEMEIIAQQEWFSKIVWACFGVTPSELGFTADSNRATEIAQSKVFKRKAIKPLLKLMEYHINTQIMPEFGFDDIEFRFVEYDPQEDLEKHKLYEIQLKNNIRTINEIREDMGLPPVEGGDEIQKPQPMFGNGFNKESQFNGDEESDLREKMNFEPKAFETDSPTVPKENEKPKKPDSALIRDFREKEKELVALLEELMGKPKVIAQIKAGEDRFQMFLNNMKKLFGREDYSDVLKEVVDKPYLKALDKLGIDLQQNFFPNKEAVDFLKKYNFDLVKNMNSELANKLESTLSRGFIEDKPLSQLKRDVKKLFDTTEARAKTIVRTEKSRAANYGRMEGAKQSGIAKGKTIDVHVDDKTSPLCKRMANKYEGKILGLNEKFTDEQTGESWSAPPFHANCRTTLLTPRKKGAE